MLQIGIVFVQFVEETNPPKEKYCIIVGLSGDNVASVVINSGININYLPPTLQSIHMPLTTQQCPFLDHNSFADCSLLIEDNKTAVNNLLQTQSWRIKGQLNTTLRDKICEMVKRSKAISVTQKRRFGIV